MLDECRIQFLIEIAPRMLKDELVKLSELKMNMVGGLTLRSYHSQHFLGGAGGFEERIRHTWYCVQTSEDNNGLLVCPWLR